MRYTSWLFAATLSFSLSTLLTAADWFVAPNGDDAAPGTLERPFATVTRAQRDIAPGDTVFFRGGLYRPEESQIARRKEIFAAIFHLEKSGEKDRPILYRAYQEEKPVFDCARVKPADRRVTAFLVTGSWLRIEGLEVTGVQVTMKRHTQSICFESQGSHNIFERLAMHDGQAIGIYHVRGSENLFLNCDAWNNWDHTSEDGRGGNVDGFGCHPPRGSTGNRFRGCRAWFNSDDGFDCINAAEPVVFEQCWAAYNGLSADGQKLADGNGFKAGGYGSTPAERLPKPIPRHVVQRCIAVGNKSSGFYANHHPGGCDWLHNSAYRNGTNFHMLGRLADNRTDIDGRDHELINNLSYGSRRDVAAIDFAKCKLAGNSFTLGLRLTKDDFVGLDEQELLQPRGRGGQLPHLQFLRPSQAGKLVGAGQKTGELRGDATEIGAIEN